MHRTPIRKIRHPIGDAPLCLWRRILCCAFYVSCVGWAMTLGTDSVLLFEVDVECYNEDFHEERHLRWAAGGDGHTGELRQQTGEPSRRKSLFSFPVPTMMNQLSSSEANSPKKHTSLLHNNCWNRFLVGVKKAVKHHIRLMEVLFSSGAGAAHTNKKCLLGLFSIVVLAIYVNSCYDIMAINIFIG